MAYSHFKGSKSISVNRSLILTISNAKATLSCELDQISPDAAKAIHRNSLAFPIDRCNSVCNMLGDILRSDRVPALIVNLDASIKLAKEIVSVFVELSKFLILRFLVIDIIISLGSLVSIIVVGMVDEGFGGSLDDHDALLLRQLVRMDQNIDFVQVKVLNRKQLGLAFVRMKRCSIHRFASSLLIKRFLAS